MLDGKHAIVTGGARGIGAAVARRFVSEGATVTIADRDASLARVTATALGAVADVLELDVSSAESVAQGFSSVHEQHGRIEILVNSAGIRARNVAATELALTEWQSVLDVNLTGTFLSCVTAVPYLRKSGYGRIVNVASIAGLEGNPNASAYSASKAGVIAFTKSLGKELATEGILVNVVAPSATATPMLEASSESQRQYMIGRIPMRRVGQPAELAALVAWLASPECSFSTGAVYDFSGGRAVYK